jgi:hypothetical protein
MWGCGWPSYGNSHDMSHYDASADGLNWSWCSGKTTALSGLVAVHAGLRATQRCDMGRERLGLSKWAID